MARHPRPPSPSPSPQRAPSDSDLGFDPVQEWLVDLDKAMASELSRRLGLAEEAPVLGAPEPAVCGAVKVPEYGAAAAESRGFGVKEEALLEEEDGLPAQSGASRGGEFGVKEKSEIMSCGLGGQLGPDQVPVPNIGGDEVAKVDVSEGVVDAELSTAAADAEMNTAVSAKEEMVGGEGKEEELQSSEDEEEVEESSEASSSSEEEGDDQRAKKAESSEASSSSDEEETKARKHGGGVGIDALLEEGDLMVGSDDGEEEAPKGPIKSRHEVEVLPPVPKIEVQLEPHHKTLPVGAISAIMGESVIVEGSVQHNPLNEGSILWITQNRTPLGIVDELFGPVKHPYYLVRYNSAEEVPAGIGAGTAVSFVTEFADHILNMKELYSKGYDASGDNDENQADEPEFSDDEKEAEYKRSLRTAKRQTDRQLGSKKPSDDKKRAQPRARGAGFQKDIPPKIPDVPTTGHQSQPHFHCSDKSPVVADDGTCPLGPQNFPMNAPMMLPPVPVNPAMLSPIQLANQMGGSFINPSQQFLPQQPNMVWPGGLPLSPHPNMGFEGAALAAHFMQNMLIGANQFQQQFQNPNFGGFPMPPPQFMPQSGMPANPMPFSGPPANPPFCPAPPSPMGQGNFGQSPHMAGQQGPVPGFPNAQGFGHRQPPPGDGGQPPMQFNSGQLNQGNSSFRGRSPPQRGGRHSPGRGRGRHRK